MKHFIKITLIVIGTISLVLGIIGVFLPLIPTTPFLILTAACYAKGSEKLHDRLINHKYIGSYIKNYRDGKGVPKKAKVYALCLLWFNTIFSVVFVIPIVHVKIMLVIIAIIVTFHVSKVKTLNDINEDPQSAVDIDKVEAEKFSNKALDEKSEEGSQKENEESE